MPSDTNPLNNAHLSGGGNIVLVGFMCSGKSTVARLLAAKLGMVHFEMDDFIIAQSGCKSIPEIFTAKGESYFRDLESAACIHARGLTRSVISTGGGAIMRPNNLTELKAAGPIVFLQTAFETVLKRSEAQGADGRPLFSSAAQTRELFDARSAHYRQAADISVSTDSASAEQVAEEVAKAISSAF